MTLPVVPGSSMSFSQINTELGLSSTATISLNDAAVRTLAGVGASPATIAITNLSGKSNTFSFTISSGQTNANLRTLAVNAGWPGTSKVIATIGSGIYISSNSTGTPALTVDGSFPGGVELINNGLIVGMGGSGGAGRNIVGGSGNGGAAGSAGGLALSVSVALTLNNAGTVAGGGGGGGGGAASSEVAGKYSTQYSNAGGGGGGGRSSNAANSAGGAGGSASPAGSPYQLFPGSAGGSGTVSSAGSGGARGGNGGNGGAGGGWGASGSTGGSNIGAVNRGGPFGGGSAGGCITGNSNITYIATGTRLGSIS